MMFYVFSRGTAESVAPSALDHVIISIKTPGDADANIPTNNHTRGMLRLALPDADTTARLLPGEELFSIDQANQVWDFLETTYDNIDLIVVHCDAGRCRSPAIAAAVSKVMMGNDDKFFRQYTPNMHVYRTMLDAYYSRD